MHKPCKRKDKENEQAQRYMKLKHQRDIGHILMSAAAECGNMLRPFHEFYHLMTVKMLHGFRNGIQSEKKLGQEQG